MRARVLDPRHPAVVLIDGAVHGQGAPPAALEGASGQHAVHVAHVVEDVLRDVVLMLREDDKIDSFEVECESLESIHNHSAWAYQAEG